MNYITPCFPCVGDVFLVRSGFVLMNHYLFLCLCQTQTQKQVVIHQHKTRPDKGYITNTRET